MQETIRARVDSQLKEQFKFAAKSHGQNASQSLREFMADSPKSTITPSPTFLTLNIHRKTWSAFGNSFSDGM